MKPCPRDLQKYVTVPVWLPSCHQSSQSKGLEMFFSSHCSLQDINKQECQQTPQELQKTRAFIVAMKLEISEVSFLDSFLQILLIHYSYGHVFVHIFTM